MHFKDFLLKEANDWTYVYHVSPIENIYKLRVSGRKGQAYKQRESGFYVAPKFQDAVEWWTSYVAHKKGGVKSDHTYKTAYIYKIKVPKDVLKNSWYETFWEPEYFISERYLNQLEIVSKQKFDADELSALSSRYRFHRNEQKTNRLSVDNLKTVLAVEYKSLKEKYISLRMKGYDIKISDPDNLLEKWYKYRFEKPNDVVHKKFSWIENFIISHPSSKMNSDFKMTINQKSEQRLQNIISQLNFIFDKMEQRQPIDIETWIKLQK
jgi:hypothetical protein